ncbi:NAD(P)H-hydrate dehydratase [Pyramidobacter sp.]|uniref:NAD(P)H-hydrate dehydratase n=1 Tax=Pyramidobacter sp. TaxID=1943581 RepID=UPI002A838DD3|nr:NAD(P)H-hydrate dehydratase [Pyramidobacter sp.]
MAVIPWYANEKVRALDARLIESGLSGLELMERVGRGVVDFILKQPLAHSALILAGAGNNGGDGFVVARLLTERGWKVAVLLSHEASRSQGDAAVNLTRLGKMAVPVVESRTLDETALRALLNSHDLVVDALLGTGAAGAPRGETARLIAALNRCRLGRHVLAVDIPSGAEGGEGVEAQWTCTAGGRKLSMATGRGAALAGDTVLIPLDGNAAPLLGVPDALELEERDVRNFLPRRRIDDHKGCRGGVLIVAGSKRYRGAALLAVRGALRAGAGLAVLASVPEVLNALAVSLPEAIAEPLDTPGSLEAVMRKWRPRCAALLIGSGLDRDDRARELCRIGAQWNGPSLWDGDGLYWLGEDDIRPVRCCLTPHEGEAAALLGGRSPVRDRFEAAGTLARRRGPVLLKGYRSLVVAPEQTPWIVPRGDRTLSVPGSGDVLAGTCAALLAAGVPEEKALALGAWCHGAAGETLGRTRGRDGMLAHEVADRLPAVLKELNGAC